MSELNRGRGDSITILLVEDNPGDVRYISEMFRDAVELSTRAKIGGSRDATERKTNGTVSGPTIVHEVRLADGLDHLDEDVPDVVLLDLDLPDSRGLETVRAVRDRSASVPIVVLTGLRDQQIGLEALDEGADEYLVKDEITADLLIRSVYYAIERKAHEQELQRQRNQLASLNSLNELVHEISQVAIESSTREELEQLVCEHLANSESYLFAWIGEIDEDSETVRLSTEAGVEGYLDSVSVPIDDTSEGRGPTSHAIRTGEVQVAQNVLENSEYDFLENQAREHGFQSVAAIPITYEGTIFGVLSVFSDRPYAFQEDERTVVGRLGEVIGHVITAIERKEALMSEDVVEIRFLVEDVLGSIGVDIASEGTITFDQVIPVTEDVILEYGTVSDDAIGTLKALVEHFPHAESLELFGEGKDSSRFELRLTRPPLISMIASYGGRVESATIDGGDYHINVHLPPGGEVSRVVEGVKEHYPTATVIAQRNTIRPERRAARSKSVEMADLTERQRSTLESAYLSGYFDWPRGRTGEELAESLGVSPPTFHQHLRLAEKKIFGMLMDME